MKVQMIVFAVVTANTIILVQASTTSLWLDRSDVQKLAISVVNSCPLGTNGHLFLFLQVGTQQYCGILPFSFTKYCARTTNAAPAVFVYVLLCLLLQPTWHSAVKFRHAPVPYSCRQRLYRLYNLWLQSADHRWQSATVTDLLPIGYVRCKKSQQMFEVLSFSIDTGPLSFCHLFIALSIVRCRKSDQKSAVHVCQVATVVVETTQLVLSQFKSFLL